MRRKIAPNGPGDLGPGGNLGNVGSDGENMSKSKGRRVFHRPEQSRPQQSFEIANTFQKAVTFHQQGQLALAETWYQTILRQAPNHIGVRRLLGLIECQRGNFTAAVELIGQALKLDPKDDWAHLHIGYALLELKRYEDALASCDRALAIKPGIPEALNNRGIAQLGLARYGEAIDSFDRALAIRPDFAEGLSNRGNALLQLARHEEALASCDRALAVRPDYPDALNNRGLALLGLARHGEALASYDRALAIKPDFVEALSNRGNVLLQLRRYEEALASNDRALSIRPDHAGALNNRGNALLELGRHEEAAKDFERLLIVKPDWNYAQGNMLHAQLHCGDWKDYGRRVELIINDIAAGKRAAHPFIFLSISELPRDQLQCAQTFSRDRYPASTQAVWKGERYGHDRIRVAYLSADFYRHPVAYLTAGLFEAHDKSRFEITAISFGPDSKDDMQTRLENSFDHFIDVKGKSDHDVALLLKALEIDIALDLKGYTERGRTGILAHRAAPIQVNYLGYPGTMGADYIDYVLADRFVIQKDEHSFYAEKVAYLPDTYQANDSKRRVSGHTPTRTEAGLPETGFVFCSFNDSHKITPAVFDAWMRLLHQVAGSVLWLLEGNATAIRNLRLNAEKRGVAPERLVFAPRVKLEDHLARHHLAGFFLDTLPYNAHTTASDALWAGLPVLTCVGSSFAGRVAGSLLNAVGLPELITDNLEDYEALALKLARDEHLLAAITAKLAQNRETFPLFDTDRFCRHIESAYETMWERYQRGEPPASFTVAAR
jgi:protein O-GlcNAc transferase